MGGIHRRLQTYAQNIAIGCQNCMECRKQKSREWQIRLQEEIKHNKNAKWITLTFSNQSIKKLHETLQEQATKKMDKEQDQKTIDKIQSSLLGYNLDNNIATLAIRYFLERYRKQHGKSIKHWLITELGHNGTENIHLHGFIWTDQPLEEIEKIWKYGFMWKGQYKNGKYKNYVNDKTINYSIKYVHKVSEKHTTYKPIILCSKGIGKEYCSESNRHTWKKNKYNDKETDETYRTNSGHKLALPIYYRNKIYNEEEREKLWIQKLDKQERWVLGEKISIKNGEDEYKKALEWAQKYKLGYNPGAPDWNIVKYENERRIINIHTRIRAA